MADGSVVTLFDPYAVRAQFPILSRQVNGKPLIWLDNAATTHKPQSVIDRPILALTVAALKAERKKTEALTREIALIKKFIGME